VCHIRRAPIPERHQGHCVTIKRQQRTAAQGHCVIIKCGPAQRAAVPRRGTPAGRPLRPPPQTSVTVTPATVTATVTPATVTLATVTPATGTCRGRAVNPAPSPSKTKGYRFGAPSEEQQPPPNSHPVPSPSQSKFAGFPRPSSPHQSPSTPSRPPPPGVQDYLRLESCGKACWLWP